MLVNVETVMVGESCIPVIYAVYGLEQL